eukprot:COSAG05_NODE_7_length_42457_cov_58.929152_33_plen_223_part_00
MGGPGWCVGVGAGVGAGCRRCCHLLTANRLIIGARAGNQRIHGEGLHSRRNRAAGRRNRCALSVPSSTDRFCCLGMRRGRTGVWAKWEQEEGSMGKVGARTRREAIPFGWMTSFVVRPQNRPPMRQISGGHEFRPHGGLLLSRDWRKSTPPHCTSWARNQNPPPSKLLLYTKHLHSSTTSLRDSHPRCTSRLHTREPTQKHRGTPGRAGKKPNRRERSEREH